MLRFQDFICLKENVDIGTAYQQAVQAAGALKMAVGQLQQVTHDENVTSHIAKIQQSIEQLEKNMQELVEMLQNERSPQAGSPVSNQMPQNVTQNSL